MRQKHENITLSIPADLNAMLHAKFPRRGMSNYVATALREALKRDQGKEMEALEAAYEEAEKDQKRKKVVREWSNTADDVQGWEW